MSLRCKETDSLSVNVAMLLNYKTLTVTLLSEIEETDTKAKTFQLLKHFSFIYLNLPYLVILR